MLIPEKPLQPGGALRPAALILTRMRMLMEMREVAERAGLKYDTVRNYHNVASARRRSGDSRPGDFPPPDTVKGRTPLWWPETVDGWLARRPGRGAGGGRPRKSQA